MGSILELYSPRIVNQCGYHFYTKPQIHKDRIIDTHDIIYLSRGEMELYQNSISYLLKPGDLIFLHATQHHYGVNPCSIGTEFSYFHMFASSEDCYVDDTPDVPNFTNTLVNCKNYPDIREIINLIDTCYWKNNTLGKAEVSALCNLLICRLCEISKITNTLPDETLTQAIQFIHQHPDRFVLISELAEMFFLSEKTLRNKFLKTYKKTPHQYQMDMKLTEAKQILRNEKKISLRDIAENFGFYDQFHFSKRFKEKFGIPPSEYRKQQQAKASDKYTDRLY